jgi:O-antigen/teichoic acid export membrane protein
VTGSPVSEGRRPGEAAEQTTGGSVLRGSAWNATARILQQAYVLVTSVVAARFLGPDGLGRQSFISFVALSTTVLFTSGLSLSLMRSIGEQLGAARPGTALDLISWAWKLTAVAAVLGSALLVGIAVAGADPQAAWVLASVGSACAILHAVPSAVLIGAQRWREATIVGLITGSIGVPATIAVLAAGGGITGIFAVEAAVGAGNLVWTTIYMRRFERGVGARPRRDPHVRRLVARYAAWSTLSATLSLIVFRRSEFFFLEAWSTDAEIALYSIAFAAINALVLAFDSVGATLLPAVATLHGAGEADRIRSGYRRTVGLMLLVALPTAAGVLAVGPELVRLVYGDEYSGTEPVLRLMTVVLPFVPVMYAGNALLIGMGYVWPLLVASGVAAVANVALAALLIPRYEAVGAALANGGAQVLVALVVAGVSARVIGGSPIDIPAVARSLAVAVATGLAAWVPVTLAPGAAGAFAGVITGVCAFMLAGRLFRILAPEDADWLLHALGKNAVTRAVTPALRFLSRAAPAE